MNDRSWPINASTVEELYRLGISLLEQKRFDEAAKILGQAYALSPNHPGAGIKFATALINKGDAAQAVKILSPIALGHPHLVEAHGMLGNAYALSGQWESAVAAFQRAVELAPNLAVAHFGLGSALANQGKISQAIAAFRSALRLNYQAAHCNLGVALLLTGFFDEAAAELNHAMAFNPNDAVAHWNHALLNLLRGDWGRAWPEYEWRWRWNQFPSRRRQFTQPMWRGEELGGKTILLHAEQGFGDTIQLVRYLPLVSSRGAKVVVECQDELLPIFQRLPGDYRWVRFGQELPAFDVHCPLASLPMVFGTTLQTIPEQTPPLGAADDRIALWRERMGPTDARPRVGICWAGNATFNGDHTRSVKLEQLHDLLAIEKFKFFSLQKGVPAERIQEIGFDKRLIDLGSEFNDFADTAAVIALCDLIVTTDTSVPHLAGAMDKNVWVMLQYVPDWRWLLDREDSPWYPSARLFRQTALGDWDGVIARVARALANM
jgi:Flp pilus assembly protein TadD